jgi:hypothetical protein
MTVEGARQFPKHIRKLNDFKQEVQLVPLALKLLMNPWPAPGCD